MSFARSIMTTYTYPNAVHQHAAEGSVTGFAKGSGMIHPNMATMLGFLLTDGHVDGPATAGLLRRVADRSFHRTTVDGDTSPNDTLLLLASGTNHGSTTSLEQLLTRTSQTLARTIAADGEGATRLVTGQDDGAHVVVVGCLVEMAQQAVGIILPPAIACPRAAQRQDAGVALLSIEKRHGVLLDGG